MSEGGAAPKAENYRYVILLVSTYLILASNGALLLLVVALKPLATEFGWSRSVPSLAYSLQFVGTGIGGIVMGLWFDRHGAAPVVRLGIVMLGTGAMLSSMVTEAWHLYLIWGLMMGFLGQATMYAPLMVNVMRWFEDRRGFAVGVVAAGQSLAGAIWPPIFRHFNETAGWQSTFFWYGLFAMITALPLTLLLRKQAVAVSPTKVAGSAPGPANGSANADASQRAPEANAMNSLGVSNRSLQIVLCLAIVGCCFAMSMPLAHVVAHTSDLGHATSRAAEMLSVILATTLLVRLLGGALILDKVGGLVALLIFSGLQAGALALYAFVDGLLALYVVSFLFGLGYGGIGMCYPVIVREYLPASQAGRRLGIVNLFGALGMALGGWTAGLVFDADGAYATAFLMGVALNIANLVLIGMLLLRRRPPASRGVSGAPIPT